MTATEYNPDPETVICRVTDRTFPKIFEMYFFKRIRERRIALQDSSEV